ncbi:MAG: hypothetical protein KDF58_12580 [Alphaproteobacteria bacterium]|nr:hypothetical protein [Alphaproteobacteria bacterium]HPF45862.1 hypothetical protein [Emcibacteraceae bacterium]
MTIENLKKLGLLFIAVFAMAAVFELVSIPKMKDDEPLNIVFSSAFNSEASNMNQNGIDFDSCEYKLGVSNCICSLIIEPHSKNYIQILNFLKNTEKGVKYYNSHTDSELITIWRGKDRMSRTPENESWSISAFGHILHNNSETYAFGGDPLEIKETNSYLTEDSVRKLKIMLDRIVNEQNSDCKNFNLNYPTILNKPFWQYDYIEQEKLYDKFRYINPASGEDGSA